jgi:hypothetical protein
MSALIAWAICTKRGTSALPVCSTSDQGGMVQLV